MLMKKVLFRVVLCIVILFAGLVVYIMAAWDKDYSNIPLPTLAASKDSAIIARGKYLAYGPAHCAL